MDMQLPIPAKILGEFLGASIVGDETREVRILSSLETAQTGSLSYCATKKYRHLLDKVREAVVLTKEDLVVADLPITYIIVREPKAAFVKVAKTLIRKEDPWRTVSEKAVIHPSVTLSEGVGVGPFVVILEGSTIGKRTTIFPNVYIGRRVVVGDGCEIYPGVTLLDGVRIGNRVKIYSGTVVGSEGFGLVENNNGIFSEVPQVGDVYIGDDSRIGALCTIDRATFGQTRVGKGCKLDDHVHVGHNCSVGNSSILCAQVGLGGSSVLGENVIFGGQAAVADHVSVGAKARLAAQGGTSTDLKAGESYFMSPAIPLKEGIRVFKYFRKLPEIWARLRKIESLLGENNRA